MAVVKRAKSWQVSLGVEARGRVALLNRSYERVGSFPCLPSQPAGRGYVEPLGQRTWAVVRDKPGSEAHCRPCLSSSGAVCRCAARCVAELPLVLCMRACAVRVEGRTTAPGSRCSSRRCLAADEQSSRGGAGGRESARQAEGSRRGVACAGALTQRWWRSRRSDGRTQTRRGQGLNSKRWQRAVLQRYSSLSDVPRTRER
jgi:hypothetical protein